MVRRSMYKKCAILLGFAAVLSAPTKNPAEPSAVVEFQGGYDGSWAATINYQKYHLARGRYCDKYSVLAKFKANDSTVKRIKFKAGNTVDFRAEIFSRAFNILAREEYLQQCENRIRFNPEPGKEYLLFQKLVHNESCAAFLVDKSTMAEPESVEYNRSMACADKSLVIK